MSEMIFNLVKIDKLKPESAWPTVNERYPEFKRTEILDALKNAKKVERFAISMGANKDLHLGDYFAFTHDVIARFNVGEKVLQVVPPV
jgi:hypothetical protein